MTNPLWAEYARLQKMANSRVLDDRAWAIDDALSDVIDAIAQNVTKTSDQVENLIGNRRSKHRARRHTFAANVSVFPSISNSEFNAISARYELRRVEKRCSAREWRILVASGYGYTTAEIANAEGVPEATVKTWVRRARLQLVA